MRDSVQIRLPLCTACFVTVVSPASPTRGSVAVSALWGAGGEPAGSWQHPLADSTGRLPPAKPQAADGPPQHDSGLLQHDGGPPQRDGGPRSVTVAPRSVTVAPRGVTVAPRGVTVATRSVSAWESCTR